MKRMLVLVGLFAGMLAAVCAQERRFGLYAVGFYNQENLFYFDYFFGFSFFC